MSDRVGNMFVGGEEAYYSEPAAASQLLVRSLPYSSQSASSSIAPAPLEAAAAPTTATA